MIPHSRLLGSMYCGFCAEELSGSESTLLKYWPWCWIKIGRCIPRVQVRVLRRSRAGLIISRLNCGWSNRIYGPEKFINSSLIPCNIVLCFGLINFRLRSECSPRKWAETVIWFVRRNMFEVVKIHFNKEPKSRQTRYDAEVVRSDAKNTTKDMESHSNTRSPYLCGETFFYWRF